MLPLWTIFLTVFLAELGDKTQLASLLFSTEKAHSPWAVFAMASLALVVSTGIAVLLGYFAAEHLQKWPLKLIAGTGFLLLGVWTLAGHFRA